MLTLAHVSAARKNRGVNVIEIAVEVAPIGAPVIERLKQAGYSVYQGKDTWRVMAEFQPKGAEPVTTQAINLANDILLDFRLDPLHSPPTVVLRSPDALMEAAVGELVLEDARRANDPDPLQRAKRKWWQRQMELGLGERKGD